MSAVIGYQSGAVVSGPLAGWFRRAQAALLDAVFLASVEWMIDMVVDGIVMHTTADFPRTSGVFYQLTFCFGLLLPAMYYFTEVTHGVTPGKMLLRLRIRSVQGGETNLQQRLSRYMLKNGGLLTVGVGVCVGSALLAGVVTGQREFHMGARVVGLAWLIGGLQVLLAAGAFLRARQNDHLALYDIWTGTSVREMIRAGSA